MNPYHHFLKLSETEASPDHYSLLGVPQFTNDVDAIRAAAITRNSQLRSWDNSDFHREANRLLDEVVAATMVLEDPARKADYDRDLRQKLDRTEAAVPPATVTTVRPVRPPAPVTSATAFQPKSYVVLRAIVIGSAVVFWAAVIIGPSFGTKPGTTASLIYVLSFMSAWLTQIVCAGVLANRMKRWSLVWSILSLTTFCVGPVILALIDSRPPFDPLTTLQKVRSLLDAGLITQQEYEAKKREVLSRL